MVWTADDSGNSLYVSESSKRVYGFDAQALFANGKRYFDLVHPDDAPRVRDAFDALFFEGRPYDQEFRLRTRDRAYIWIRDCAIGTYELNGRRCTVGISTDITARRRAEEALRNAQLFAQSTIDALSAHICVLNEVGTIITVNSAWREFAKANTSAEAQQRPAHDGLCEGANYLAVCDRATAGTDALEAAQFAAGIRQVLAGECSVYSLEYACHSPNEQRWFIGRVTRFVIEGATWAVIEHDNITERKVAEGGLRAAKQVAEEANQAKTRFLAHMSHEIRTPMNGVLGMLELLGLTEVSPQQQQYIDVSRASGEALLAIIEDILDLSKIEARKLTLLETAFDLPGLLRNVMTVMLLQAGQKGLMLDCELAPDLPQWVYSDPKRLRQVLLNLVANAVKFTHRGEVKIQVVIDACGDNTWTIRFIVSDTGIGLSESQRATIFEPFVQADPSTTRKYGGTGLGLAISKQLVEMMGGTIGVDSEEGRGSTFWFTVPLKAAEALDEQGHPDTASHVDTGALGEELKFRQLQPRILLAEDNSTNRIVTVEQLAKLGIQARAVTNGAEAVEALENTEYDLVLMDCNMPVMDGFEATHQIRAMGKSQLPIIALTADAMVEDRERCLREGMSDYLSKPVQLPRLAGVIAKWLAPSPVCEEAACEAAGVFDEQEMLGRLMNDRALAGKIIQAFLSDCPLQLAALCERIRAEDVDGARMHAHKVKGAASYVAASRLRDVAFRMELAAKDGNLNAVQDLVRSAGLEFGRYKAALRAAGWPA